ncbi:MAG: GyrI-like domain-containing protein [Alphaproteobacteria bacterium]|nr:GyrI-like domain-containing protein [Alphaproteobacteria bacterium]
MQKGKVVYLKPTWLAGVHGYGPYDETVPVAWRKIFDWLDSGMHFEMPEQGFGLTYDDPRAVATDRLRYVAGVEVPSSWRPPEGCPVSRVPFQGGSYAVVPHHGPYTAVGEVISNYRNEWVPRLGLCLDATRPLLTIYRSDSRVAKPEDQVADICLPIAALAGE